MELSEATGPDQPALLEETIGANLTRTVAPVRRPRGAGRMRDRPPLDLPRVRCRDVDAVAGGLLARRARPRATGSGVWAPNCAEWTLTQYATARIGVILVNINPAYRTHELTYAINQSGLRMLVCADAYKTSDYRGDGRARSAATARRWSASR